MDFNVYSVGEYGMLSELNRAVCKSLTEIGHNVVNRFEGYVYKGGKNWNDVKWASDLYGFPYKGGGVSIFLCGAYAIFKHKAFSMPDSLNVLFNLEQYGVCFNEFDCIFDIFGGKQDGFVYTPLGYSSEYERNDITVEEENINVLSLGKHFIKDGVLSTRIFGDERDKLILSSKINLIIQKGSHYMFPILRYLLIACKKKFVLTDPHSSYHPEGIEKNMHFIKDIDKDIAFWATENEKRQEAANRVYENLKREFDFTKFMDSSINKIKGTHKWKRRF
jgi:hypothetical protein